MSKLTYIILLIFILASCKGSFSEREFSLSSPFEYTMIHEINRAFDRAELIVDGHFSGLGKLIFSPFPDGRWFELVIEGDIEFSRSFTQSWYMNQIIVEFIPLEPSIGSLRVRFRVF